MSGVEPLVHTVWKKCWLCGRVWEGRSFVPQPTVTKDNPLPGMCGTCIVSEEARVKEMSRRVTESGVPLVELQPPREPGE